MSSHFAVTARLLAGGVMLVGLAACSRPGYVGTDGIGLGPGRGTIGDRSIPGDRVGAPAEGAAPAVGRKQVTGMESPATLVARDGTRCIVPPERFSRTRVGQWVWCAWGATPD